jgi:hypothetical protein
MGIRHIGETDEGYQPAKPRHDTKRRLAAILAGDVAGYSRLMGANEVGTLTRPERAVEQIRGGGI